MSELTVLAPLSIEAHAVRSGASWARVRRTGEKVVVMDGPFIESKEVVGGFALLQANSKAEAIELTKQFLAVAGDGECELRQLYEAGTGRRMRQRRNRDERKAAQ